VTGAFPGVRPGVGILLTIAPGPDAAADIPTLLRIAIDAAQVGAGRLHLPADLPDPAEAVAALRQQTQLVLTTDPDGTAAVFCDRPGRGFDEVVLDPAEPAVLLAEVARLAADSATRRRTVSVAGRGAASLPVLLAGVAAGLHVRVGTADTPSLTGAGGPNARPDIGLIGRAAGLARIAGRPPMLPAVVSALLGLDPTAELPN
jgi:hypothetical protein